MVSSEIVELTKILEQIVDPELDFISIKELGILQRVEENAEGVRVIIAPTFSGCPALKSIETEIEKNLSHFFKGSASKNYTVVKEYHPWSVDKITEVGKKKLLENGYAVPEWMDGKRVVWCPRCGSDQVKIVSEFGATACKSFARCESCREPFEVMGARGNQPS